MLGDRPGSTVTSEYATPPHSPIIPSEIVPPRPSPLNSTPYTPENDPSASVVGGAAGPEPDKEGATPAESTAFLTTGKDSEAIPPQPQPGPITTTPFRRRLVLWPVALVALVAVVLAVIIPVYFTVIHKSHGSKSNNAVNSGSGGGGGPGSGTGNPGSSTGATSGGNGSTIISGNASFTYSNPFGGYWVYDPKDPFNDDARPNSWTPPLNTSWDWATNRVYGVNLGGLFVLEPFISPALFQKYPTAVDEWTLSQAMAADTGSGGGLQAQLEAHYDTFVTEQDIAEIAGAGLNWIRLPIPYWAIETWPGEPFLARVCWKYILRLIGWARKYGLRIYLDLHTVPGSQNAFNHSGRLGQINFLNGIMGIANAQRTLDYIRIITEFISQPEYKNVIPIFGIANEAFVSTIGQTELTGFYLQAHNMIRSITGYGEGNGPYIAIHDGFIGLDKWANLIPGSDRIALDTHPYISFDGQPNTEPIAVDDGLGESGGIWPKQACGWGPGINNSQLAFGVTISGEFSSATNDCGLFLLGVGKNPTFQGDCTPFTNWQNWNQTFKDGVRDFSLASMDALRNWWFWTWKIGNSSTSGTVETPLWSYQLGLQNGWIPKDPRTSSGKCQALGAAQAPFAGTYSAWQTGGAGAGTIAPTALASFPWPPATISAIGGALYAALPTYTPTGSISTLPPPQLTPKVSEGNGWVNAKDTAPAMVTVSGCSYPNAWDSVGAVAPTAPCPAGAPSLAARAAAKSTPPPASAQAGFRGGDSLGILD
ncbi:glycoside hydrolase superfamily [Lactifluus subvellereus]|nr:glycoside hydrolase superfamily [Lactifluus subvellereus]